MSILFFPLWATSETRRHMVLKRWSPASHPTGPSSKWSIKINLFEGFRGLETSVKNVKLHKYLLYINTPANPKMLHHLNDKKLGKLIMKWPKFYKHLNLRIPKPVTQLFYTHFCGHTSVTSYISDILMQVGYFLFCSRFPVRKIHQCTKKLVVFKIQLNGRSVHVY